MKTILFIDKGGDDIWSSYLQHGYLIEGLKRSGLFEVCAWHPGARSARGAVPNLAKTLGEEEIWTAVVVCDLRKDASELLGDEHFDNPFDYEDSYEATGDEPVRESSHALVRLCQMLGGIPEKVNLAQAAESDAADNDASSFEFPQSQEYYDLIERYRTGLPLPQRIICISPRTFDEDLYKSRARELEAQGNEGVLESGFWERNDYPSMTRFVTFDWIEGPKDATDGDFGQLVREEDLPDSTYAQRVESFKWLRFWSGVLTLLSSDLSSALLKPYRLYLMNPHVKVSSVRTSLSPKWSEWEGAREQIEAQIELENLRVKRSEHRPGSMPDCTTNIPVRFTVREDEVTVDNVVSLVRPDWDSELAEWDTESRSVSTRLRSLLRGPQRAVLKATRRFRTESVLDSDELEYCVLSEDRLYDLEDEIFDTELKLASTTGHKAFEFSEQTEAFEEKSRTVIDGIERRTPRQVMFPSVVLLMCAALLGIAACIPSFLAYSEAENATFVVWLLMAVAPLLIVLPVLLRQRRHARETRDDFNAWVRSVWDEFDNESSRVGTRISQYATVRKMHAVSGRQATLDKPTKRGKWLEERLALVSNRMATAVLAVGQPETSSSALAKMRRMSWSELSRFLSDDSFFDAFLLESADRPFNPEHGDGAQQITVPLGFIESFSLNPVRVH